MREQIAAGLCGLGDVVNSFSRDCGTFEVSVIIKMDEDNVTLFRPYAITSDYSHTGGVTPYMGFEEYDVSPRMIITRLQKKEPRI